VLDTPNGQIVKALIKDNCKIGISSRGLGTVTESTVNDDFQLITWDIVQNPSNYGSFVNGILEGVEFDIDKEKNMNEEIENLKNETKTLKEEIETLKTENTELKEYKKKYLGHLLTENITM